MLIGGITDDERNTPMQENGRPIGIEDCGSGQMERQYENREGDLPQAAITGVARPGLLVAFECLIHKGVPRASDAFHRFGQ
jgi:hypothetical protein